MNENLLPSTVNSRRAFLGQAARACLGVGLGSALTSDFPALHAYESRDQGGRRPAVIYIFLEGGASHLDTFDTKDGTAEQGPLRSLQTSVAGLRVSEYFPELARRMSDFSIVRSMVTNQGTHAPARKFLHTSYVPEGDEKLPALAAWSAQSSSAPDRLLNGAAIINPFSGYPSAGCLDPNYAPLAVGDAAAGLQNSKRLPEMPERDFAAGLELARELSKPFRARFQSQDLRTYDGLYDEAVRLMKSSELDAFDITKETAISREQYGSERFGQGCLLARRLVEHGFHFVEVAFPGWDTHSQHFEKMKGLTATLDRSLAVLSDDLHNRGLWNSTMIVVATEFGRTPAINPNRLGRDHHVKAFSCLLGGGLVHGGAAYGKTDERGHEVVEDPVEIPDLNATIAHTLGVPLDLHVRVPGRERPIHPAANGTCLKKLIVG